VHVCVCYFKACIDVFGGISHVTPWDSILLAAIEMDIHQVIRQCRYVLELQFFLCISFKYKCHMRVRGL